jgi:hypothetical protein
MDKKQITAQDTLDRCIIQIVTDKQPETLEQLIKLVQQKFSVTQTEIMEHIINLQKQGKIMLKNNTASTSIKDYLFSAQAIWFWVVIILALVGAITTFIVSENASPAVYLRYVLGSLFVLYLPGYSLMRALLPQKEMSTVWQITISIVTSLVIVPITALALNYTPWGIKLVPVTLSLLALTLIFSIIAIVREHRTQLNKQKYEIMKLKKI